MNQDARSERGAQIREYFQLLREHLMLIVVCAVLTAGIALFFSLRQASVYQATSKVFLHGENVSRSLEQNAPGPLDSPEVRTATDLDLASLPAVAAQARRELKLNIDPQTLLAKIKTEAKGNSRILTITATDRRPTRSAAIADAFARQYVVFRRNEARRRYLEALGLVRKRLRRAQADLARTQGSTTNTDGAAKVRQLRRQADQLSVLASLQTGEAEVVQRATVPDARISPKPMRNTALGAILGLLLGAGLATLRTGLDRRIKDEDQLHSLLPGIPVIASLPQTARHGRIDKLAVAEAFRTLQTNLTFLDADGSLRSLLVTSAAIADGKSTTSLNLALAMAERNQRVMLLDADLRQPAVSETLGLTSRMGVSNFLSGHGGTIDDYSAEVAVNSSHRNGSGPAVALPGTLSVVPAGPVPPNPQALLSADALDGLLAQARASADRVVIDGTPLGGPFSDMLPVSKRVDGVLVVVRLNHSRRDEVKRLLDRLTQARIRPVGIVLFGTEVSDVESYYIRK